MFSKKKKTSDGIFKSIVFAHLILSLHLVFFAALGVLVVFLDGIMQYLSWILLGGMLLVGLSAFLFYRRLRKEGRAVGEVLRSPALKGRSVEVSFLGGVATLKLDSPNGQKTIALDREEPPLQLEDPEMARIRQINALAQLLEKELITLDEFNSAKQRLLKQ
jgi:hypothetical protein